MDAGKSRVDVTSVKRNDNIVIDQIMLRYRPIAPRPVKADSSANSFTVNEVINRKRVKRKYVKKTKSKDKAINNNKNWYGLDTDRTVAMMDYSTDALDKVSSWTSFDRKCFDSYSPDMLTQDLHGADLASAVEARKVTESWISLESVTGTCEDRRLLGYTDHDMFKNLESDTCPGFVTNSYDKVLWVNPAYRRMLDLDSEGRGKESEVVVWLVVKVDKEIIVKYLPAFSCVARIEYWLSGKKTRMIVPCDVCLMDSGGFAWRLDVVSALSLGTIN